MTEQPRLPSDVVEARLNHLIDRSRRGALLPEEADRFTTELRDLVRRLENTEDEVAHVKLLVAASSEPGHAVRRVVQLEAEVTRLTAGQCTHTRAMCDLHHARPVDGCPYPKCKTAREQQGPPAHLAKGTNAEDCPACKGTNPDYPFLCPGPTTA